MQDHNIPLSLFIISVYILTVLVLWNIFSNGMTQAQTQKIEYAYFERQKKCLCIVQNASFLLFLHFKMVTFHKGFEADSERSYS